MKNGIILIIGLLASASMYGQGKISLSQINLDGYPGLKAPENSLYDWNDEAFQLIGEGSLFMRGEEPFGRVGVGLRYHLRNINFSATTTKHEAIFGFNSELDVTRGAGDRFGFNLGFNYLVPYHKSIIPGCSFVSLAGEVMEFYGGVYLDIQSVANISAGPLWRSVENQWYFRIGVFPRLTLLKNKR